MNDMLNKKSVESFIRRKRRMSYGNILRLPDSSGQGSPYGCGGDYCGWCGTDWKQPCGCRNVRLMKLQFGRWICQLIDAESFNAKGGYETPVDVGMEYKWETIPADIKIN